jgi:hypothetical protein
LQIQPALSQALADTDPGARSVENLLGQIGHGLAA